MKTDEKDAKIISMLRENARESNTALAQNLGISEGAVRQRIRKLVEGGAIKKFTIEEGGAGEGNSAVVMVRARGNTKQMMKEAAKLGGVAHAYEISGEFDACLIIRGRDMGEIDQRIDEIRELESVAGTSTFIVLRKW